jgi:signal recognition particle subunit SRP54
VGEVNDLVNRFFEARKMMKQMAGQFGFGSRSATKRLAKTRKGKKGAKGKATRPGPARMPAGMPDLSALPPSLRELPPGLGMDQLPPGFDPSRLKFPKGK